jgi:hypothetical protein
MDRNRSWAEKPDHLVAAQNLPSGISRDGRLSQEIRTYFNRQPATVAMFTAVGSIRHSECPKVT